VVIPGDAAPEPPDDEFEVVAVLAGLDVQAWTLSAATAVSSRPDAKCVVRFPCLTDGEDSANLRLRAG